ncbi:MAG: T9SS type A sorting domain-containing protein [Ignavibacteriaceae bacterium]|nr:T9SS type A sorting domain-containing protein [Ignavibacteriaceae bacterium]HRQ54348.1 phospholipase D-like domain-containing protein [Ignavibacteriaceae bacterium]
MTILKYFFAALLLSGSLSAQSVIINEVYNSSGNDEWIELLVVQDSVDLRNWDIRDFSISGTAQQPLVFSNQSLWSNLKKGTVLIVAKAENSFSEDLDPSDYLLIVKSNNALYFSGNAFSIAGTSEAIQIRNNSAVHVFGVSWGSANASSLPSPKVHFTGSSSSNTSVYFNEDTTPELTSTANWTVNGASSMGAGNTALNIAWILSLRARVEGSGTVSLTPQVVSGDSVVNLNFNYIRQPQYNINALKIIFPQGFTWSQNAAQVSIENFTAATAVSADTILFSNVSFLNDSVIISIADVTTPIFTGNYQFVFQSGIDVVFGDVSPTPTLTVYGAPIPIAEAKINDENGIGINLGDLVTLRGIVTVSNQFGSPSYIQDNSGGISIYGPTFSNAVQPGDEVLVSGTITQFNGLNQLESPTLHSILSSGNEVEPVLATPSMLSGDGVSGIENYEGRLVRVNGVLVTELNGTTFSNWAYRNYMLTGSSASDTVQIRIDNDTQIIGMVAPAGRFDVVGVLSQFKTSLPFIGGYQLMPRIPSDVISNGPIIERYPEEVDLTSNSITLDWSTINPGTSRIRYGFTTNYELGVIEPDNDLRTTHNVTVPGLDVATIYNLQVFSVANSDTSFSSNIISSTTSAFPTTGEINVYFNNSVNTSVSSGVNANANANFTDLLIQKLNNAKRSIDVALYSLSGTVGANIATALVNAKNRGVKVRVIGEYDNRNTAPWTTLSSNGIPVINDAFGNNDGSGLHHNKFFIIDYRGGAADSVWVIMGSWNPTDPGTNDDRQNLVMFQDVALAGAYTVEFQEEWGSSTDTPNSVNSRFGSRKFNNTPHNFVIGGVKVQSYFSPSDGTTSRIAKTLGKAEKSINGCVMTLTRRDLADTIIAVKNRGSKTRLVLSNNTDSGTQFSYLQSNGVDIRLKGFTPGLLHHKYAVVDAEPFGYTPYVITGSHNWSSSAENSNDENTVIIQDNQIGNFYLQEFAARYYEAGGTDSINTITSVNQDAEIPTQFALLQNYPNPFNPTTKIQFEVPMSQKVELIVYDILGRKVKELYNDLAPAGVINLEFRADYLASGMYIYRLKTKDISISKKMILLK